MKVDLGIWDKLSRAAVVLIFLAAVTAVALWYTPIIQESERRQKTRFELERKIEKETAIFRQLDAETKAMQDPKTVERLARERQGLARTGEVVFQFESPATNSPSSGQNAVRP